MLQLNSHADGNCLSSCKVYDNEYRWHDNSDDGSCPELVSSRNQFDWTENTCMMKDWGCNGENDFPESEDETSLTEMCLVIND